jgi:hypothetical protein
LGGGLGEGRDFLLGEKGKRVKGEKKIKEAYCPYAFTLFAF